MTPISRQLRAALAACGLHLPPQLTGDDELTALRQLAESLAGALERILADGIENHRQDAHNTLAIFRYAYPKPRTVDIPDERSGRE